MVDYYGRDDEKVCQYQSIYGVCLEPVGCEMYHQSYAKTQLTTQSAAFSPHLSTNSEAFTPPKFEQADETYD